MRCDDVHNQLMRYVDGRLGKEQTRKVDAHLDVCPRCQRHYADEVELVGAFHQERWQAGGDALVADVMSRVEHEAAMGRAASRRPIPIRPAARVALAVAAAAALVAWWQVGVPTWSHWATSMPLRSVAARLTALQQATADAVVAVRAAWQAGSAALAHGFGLGDLLFASSPPGRITLIALFTLVAAVSCVGLVRGFQSRYAKEM